MPIKAFKCRPAVCCNLPLQPNSPVPQWIILKHILDRRWNGQNGSIRDFPECLWLLHRNCFPFSNTLVFIDLLITAENLNLPEVYPCRDCLVKEKNQENPLKHLIGIEVELVHWSSYIYLADNKKNSLENNILGEILALLWWTSSSLQSEVRFSPTLVSEMFDLPKFLSHLSWYLFIDCKRSWIRLMSWPFFISEQMIPLLNI